MHCGMHLPTSHHIHGFTCSPDRNLACKHKSAGNVTSVGKRTSHDNETEKMFMHTSSRQYLCHEQTKLNSRYDSEKKQIRSQRQDSERQPPLPKCALATTSTPYCPHELLNPEIPHHSLSRSLAKHNEWILKFLSLAPMHVLWMAR